MSKKRTQHVAKSKQSTSVLIVTIILCVLVSVVSTACIDSEPVKVEGIPTQPSTTAPISQDKETTFAIGETAALNDIYVSLINVTESTGSTFNTPSDGNIFVLCEFEITNNSSKELSVSSLMSFEAYCDDYTCSFSFSALLEKGNKNQLDGTVAAGKKLNGVIGYEVPINWKELEVHFKPDVWSDKDIVFVATSN